MEHFLFVSSSDSLNYFPKNSPRDFTIELNKELNLEGNWKMAILDIWLESSKRDYLNICCDISEPSHAQDCPIVRRLWAGEGEIEERFSFPYYLPVHTKSLKRFRTYIKGTQGDLASLSNKPLKCTFHLKKV